MEPRSSSSPVHGGGNGLEFVTRRLLQVLREQLESMGSDWDEFRKGLGKEEYFYIRPVALLFGLPSCSVMKDELLPNVTYYDLRSGNNIEVFYMGFLETRRGIHTDSFDFHSFADAIRTSEEGTRWRYSGTTELLLLNSYYCRWGVHLDFTNVFVIRLEEAIKSGLIKSATALLEEIMRRSRECLDETIVAKVSDAVFMKNAGRSLGVWIASLLKLKIEDFNNAYRSCVQDLSR
jgi:hypothetical protein